MGLELILAVVDRCIALELSLVSRGLLEILYLLNNLEFACLNFRIFLRELSSKMGLVLHFPKVIRIDSKSN